MPRYLISFDDGSMDHIPDADWVAVGEATVQAKLASPEFRIEISVVAAL